MKKVFALVVSLLLVLSLGLVVAACGKDNGNNPIDDKSFSVVDQAGRTVKFKYQPQNIITLSPSNTEIVYALGIGDRLKGNTTYCDYPEAAKSVDKVGGFSTANSESVTQLIGSNRDDFVIFAVTLHLTNGTVAKMEELNYKVVILQADSIAQLFDSMRLVDKVCGGVYTDLTIQSLEARVNAVTSKITASTTRVTIMHEVYTGHTVSGASTMMNDIINLVGGKNVAATWGTGNNIKASIENIIDANPQIITMVVNMGTMLDGTLYTEFSSNPIFSVMDAVKNKQVYVISDDIQPSRNGPRSVDVLEEMARILHPEIFGPPQHSQN